MPDKKKKRSQKTSNRCHQVVSFNNFNIAFLFLDQFWSRFFIAPYKKNLKKANIFDKIFGYSRFFYYLCNVRGNLQS